MSRFINAIISAIIKFTSLYDGLTNIEIKGIGFCPIKNSPSLDNISMTQPIPHSLII